MTDFYKNMYGPDSDSEAAPVVKKDSETTTLDIKNKSSIIKVNDKFIEVPNLSYVATLEKLIDKQEKIIKRLEHSMNQMKTVINKQASNLAELKRLIENKPRFGE